MLSRILIPVLLLLVFDAQAQQQQLDSVAISLGRYGYQAKQSCLFVHFDKNIYTNNDQVWFTAYLLNAAARSNQYHTLYISLVSNADSSVVLQEKFLIDRGVAFGDILLPDSLLSGNYRFVVNTNIKLNGKYDAEFIQPITVKSSTANRLLTNISVLSTNDEKTRNGTALIRLLTSENRFVEDAEIRYRIGKGDKILSSGKARSSVIGELKIDYPADKITAENNLLSVSVKKDNQIRYINYKLPLKNSRSLDFRYYPESGYLVGNLMSKVGFEIKDADGNAIKTKAVLFSDDQVLDTLSTNSTGIGTFNLLPLKGKRYYMKILSDDPMQMQYPLPEVLDDGVVLRFGNAMAGESLAAQLQSSNDKHVYVMVHDFSTIYLQKDFNLKAGKLQNLRFRLDSIPMGLYAVTVLNDKFKPIAERVFFANYQNLSHFELQTDRTEYTTRDSVILNIRALKIDRPISGLASISCVQSNRLSINNNLNIADYYLFERALNDLPNHPEGIKHTDMEYINNILLVKGWRRYKWPSEAVTANKNITFSMEYQGAVTRNKKNIKVPMQLNILGGDGLKVLFTDSTGKFVINHNKIFTENKARLLFSLNDTRKEFFDVALSDPLDEIKTYVHKQNYREQNSRIVQLNDFSQNMTAAAGINLKEVVIKQKKDESYFVPNGPNRCGDYVCAYNILNCTNHIGSPDNRSPVEGRRYKTPGGIGEVLYTACVLEDGPVIVNALKGINLPKEFYVSDIKNMNEPIKFATIYWNYQQSISANGNTTLTFNTGDLIGRFKIVVQGITTEGIAYGEQEINIVNK